ncbi:MAG: enoyl-CoA hydratase [Spirochaeta sp.]|jgi:enoyl-CoA hydratase|nr:enoyl-CoA hydratase [Spirochaeta sp.]RPG07073.1 MAG: enoyl-CoA hydratase [Proteobacteria bacterium TMED72]
MPDFKQIIFSTQPNGIARIILNRPEARNAQDANMLYEINDAMDIAANDDQIKVIVVSANGPHFSAGHDLAEADPIGSLKEHKSVTSFGGLDGEGIEPMFGREQEIYYGFCERWRNIPKPTMVAVHGKVIAGGLMLVWPFDIVIASEDTTFQDNTVAMGICGAEFFNHPYELGVRKAKEMLFTSDFVSAEDAHRLGAVNHVVPRDELEDFTLNMAAKIAEKRLFSLKLTKMAVNAAQDNAGRNATNQQAFALHHLLHTNFALISGAPLAPEFIENFAKKKSG